MAKLTPGALNAVNKPARYTGNEVNAVVKDHEAVDCTICLSLPDVYEVGMSNLGLKILYQTLNDRADVAAERAYAPWVDMEEKMREDALALYSLETFTPVKRFDIVGFSLQYEMIYSNALNMLDLAGIALCSEDRDGLDPFVVGGGPCAYNPEPIADFFDLFVIGEGEEVMHDLADCLIAWKKEGKPGGRREFLRRAAQIGGIYVPSFYRVEYGGDKTVQSVTPLTPEAKPVIMKRLVRDLDRADFVKRPVVPYIDIVHDRIMLELFRGCTRGCRFCQAGVIYRPVRERSPERLAKLAQELVECTGYDEISLTSLSSADYSCLGGLADELMEKMNGQKVSVSLPSLRIDSFSVDLAQKLRQVRKSGLTFAPEAGTQRLRDVINKGVTEDDLKKAAAAAFRQGWKQVKLYFMIGLPTETDEDIIGIAELAEMVARLYRETVGKRGVKVTVSVSSFVPKPHTPFQWFAQNTKEELARKQRLLKEHIKDRSIHFSYHDAKTSYLEGVFARGDRRLGKVLLKAWEMGVKFDGWSEHFKYDVWMDAFRDTGIDPDFYNLRERAPEEVLPWDHISSGADKAFLLREYQNAVGGRTTPDCRRGACGACGVCANLDVKVIDWSRTDHA